MITDKEKKEIDKKYFPNGFFWHTKNFDPQSYLRDLRQPFESLELYDSSVKSLLHNNALRFFWTIERMSKTDFISEINSQYLNYTIENMENAELWLSHTYDIVLKGVGYSQKINDVDLKAAFIEWHKSKLNELQTRKTNDSDKSKDNSNNTSFIFTNNFDQIEPNTIYNYFFDSLVKTKYLNENTLQEYLITAFQDRQEPQQRITIMNKPTNKKIQEVFYNYYKDIAGKPYGKQQNYAGLLGDYFIGFDTKKLKTNFSKTY